MACGVREVGIEEGKQADREKVKYAERWAVMLADIQVEREGKYNVGWEAGRYACRHA